jgi:hypothetical protein
LSLENPDSKPSSTKETSTLGRFGLGAVVVYNRRLFFMRASWFVLAVVFGVLSFATYPRGRRAAAVGEVNFSAPAPSQSPAVSAPRQVESPAPPPPPAKPAYTFDIYRTSDHDFVVTAPHSDDWIDTTVPLISHQAATIGQDEDKVAEVRVAALFHGKEYYWKGFRPGLSGISIEVPTSEYPADFCETLKVRVLRGDVAVLHIEMHQLAGDDGLLYVMAPELRERASKYWQMHDVSIQRQRELISSIPLR